MRSALAGFTLHALACCFALLVTPVSAQVNRCPNVSSALDVYNTAGEGCSQYRTCYNAFCLCESGVGRLNVSTGEAICRWTTRPTCANLPGCLATFHTCVSNGVSEASTKFCPLLGPLHTQLVVIAAGAFYNGSALEAACRANACRMFNAAVRTLQGCPSAIPYDQICVSPQSYVGELRIAGNFTALLNNATAKATLQAAVETDLRAVLQMPVTVTSLVSGSLIVGWTAAVSASSATLASRLAVAQASNSWLTSTTAAAGMGPLVVVGVGAPVTPAPPTPEPATASPPYPRQPLSGGARTEPSPGRLVLFGFGLMVFLAVFVTGSPSC